MILCWMKSDSIEWRDNLFMAGIAGQACTKVHRLLTFTTGQVHWSIRHTRRSFSIDYSCLFHRVDKAKGVHSPLWFFSDRIPKQFISFDLFQRQNWHAGWSCPFESLSLFSAKSFIQFECDQVYILFSQREEDYRVRVTHSTASHTDLTCKCALCSMYFYSSVYQKVINLPQTLRFFLWPMSSI